MQNRLSETGSIPVDGALKKVVPGKCSQTCINLRASPTICDYQKYPIKFLCPWDFANVLPSFQGPGIQEH